MNLFTKSAATVIAAAAILGAGAGSPPPRPSRLLPPLPATLPCSPAARWFTSKSSSPTTPTTT